MAKTTTKATKAKKSKPQPAMVAFLRPHCSLCRLVLNLTPDGRVVAPAACLRGDCAVPKEGLAAPMVPLFPCH